MAWRPAKKWTEHVQVGIQETCVLCVCVYTPLIISHSDKLEQRNSQCCSCWDESCAEKDTLLSVCAPSYIDTVHVSLLGVGVQPCSGLDLGKEEFHRSCMSPHSAATTKLQYQGRLALQLLVKARALPNRSF